MRKTTYIAGISALIAFSIGALMKYLHLTGAGILMSFGLFVFLFGFLTMFLLEKVSIESRREARLALMLLFLTLIMFFSYGFLKIFHLPGSVSTGYLSIIMIMVFLLFFSKKLEGRQLKLRKDRQLASILFTDIVGFTAMMGKDEEHALQALDQNPSFSRSPMRMNREPGIEGLRY